MRVMFFWLRYAVGEAVLDVDIRRRTWQKKGDEANPSNMGTLDLTIRDILRSIFGNVINSRNRRSGKRRRINDSYGWSD